jgi:DNA-binding NtrC family response regulator
MTLPEIANHAARAAEVELIQKILSQTMGNKTKAAERLGVSYKTLLNKIRDYEIQMG